MKYAIEMETEFNKPVDFDEMTMAASQQVVKPVQSAQEMTETNAVTTDLDVTTESEEVFEMYCEPCNREGTSVTATAFCPSCVDYLCATCLKYHKRFLSEHAYLDNDKMSRDICLEKCPTHKNEIIKFYCATCKTFACSVCKKNDHNVSCRLKYLSDLVNDLEIESGLKKLISKSDDVVRSVSKTEQLIMKKHEIISDIPRKAKTTLKNETEAMFSFFYKEMQNIEEKIKSEKKLDNGRVEGVTRKYNLLKLDIDKLSDTHKQSSKSDSNQKYTHFMKLTTFSQELEGMVVSLQGVSKQCTLSGDGLKSSVKKQVNELNEKVNTIGIAVRKFGTESKIIHEKVQRKVAAEVTTINVGNEYDEYDCRISKCFLLSHHILFVCDTNNSSVNLFNTRNKNLVCSMSVNTPPFAATKVTDTEIAIVQNHEHYKRGSVIQFLTLTKAKVLFFQKRRSIQTEMECRDIIYSQDRLIIALLGRNRCKVQIVDMEGDILNEIESDEDGAPLFVRPDYIALNPDATQLYVSDWSTGNITAVELESSKKHRIVKEFWNPQGITSDNEGFVYVVEGGTCHVQVIHPDHSDAQLLLGNDCPLQGPRSICYSNKDNKLYVGTAGNCVKVYTIIDRDFVKCETLETVEKWMQV